MVNDPEELQVAAGAFGLLGILVQKEMFFIPFKNMIIYFFSQLSITFRVDEMSYATYQPIIVQTSMEEYLPRPGTPIPESLVELFEVRFFLYSFKKAAIF